RVDANVGVGADADPDPASADALDRQEAVAEVRLRRRAGTDARTGLGKQIELGAVGVGCMHDRRPLAEAARAIEALDGSDSVLGKALFDLARLFVRVHVQRQPFESRVAPDFLEPVGGTCAHGVGGEADRNSTAPQILDLPQVLRHRFLSKAWQPASSVRGQEEDDADTCLLRGVHRRQRFLEAQVMELADRRITRGPQLAVDVHVLSADELGRLARCLGEHQLTPTPEIGSSGAAAEGTLKAVAVRIDEARQAETLGHGRILSTLMATRSVPATLQPLPNALTLARLALIPAFVGLMLSADGGHSWPAGIVFGIAGVTDQIDGFLARRWQVESDFGRIFDPLADRLMIDAAVILLVVQDHM